MATYQSSARLGVQGQRTLGAAHYCSDAHFADERARIFRRSWICVGRESDVAEAGQFIVREVGGESLIIVRDGGGQVRAHFNLCRHRGTQLCEAHAGRFGKSIQCPYHAWTYALDGALIGVPDQRDMADFSLEEHPLHQAACATWEGFVFVNLAADAEPFASAYAPLAGKWARYQLRSLVRLGQADYDVHANWKLIVQNYSECYHCAPVHPGLVKLSPPTSGGNDLTEGPFLGGYMDVTEPGGSLTLSGRACAPTVGSLAPADLQRVHYYTLFPNVLLSLHHDYVMVHRLWPLAPARTRVECEWLFHPETAHDPAWQPNDGIAFWDRTNKEDWHVSELTQRGVASVRYAPGPYSAREAMAAAFDREYLRVMAHA